VDFQKFNEEHPASGESFYMSGAAQNNSWYHKNSKAMWNKVFDAVFFIRKMYPCRKAD
jgi:hypothetical protein